MTSYTVIINSVLMVFSIVAIGIVLRKTQFVPDSFDRTFTRLTINLFFPALILARIIGNPTLEDSSTLLYAPLAGFFFVSSGYFACYLIAPFFGLRDRRVRGSFALTTGNFNYGFIPIPIAMSIFDDATIGTLFLHNVGVEIALWSIGIALLTGRFNQRSIRHIINPPLCAILFAVAITLTDLDHTVPTVVMGTFDMLGNCAIPLALLMIGMTMGNHLTGMPKWTSLRVGLPACMLRLALLPAVMLCLAVLLPFSIELKRVIVLQVAMPSAVFPIVLASHYQSDTETAIRVVLATSALSIVTLPLWLTFGLKLIGS